MTPRKSSVMKSYLESRITLAYFTIQGETLLILQVSPVRRAAQINGPAQTAIPSRAPAGKPAIWGLAVYSELNGCLSVTNTNSQGLCPLEDGDRRAAYFNCSIFSASISRSENLRILLLCRINSRNINTPTFWPAAFPGVLPDNSAGSNH